MGWWGVVGLRCLALMLVRSVTKGCGASTGENKTPDVNP